MVARLLYEIYGHYDFKSLPGHSPRSQPHSLHQEPVVKVRITMVNRRPVAISTPPTVTARFPRPDPPVAVAKSAFPKPPTVPN
jgi:hypothetical protein